MAFLLSVMSSNMNVHERNKLLLFFVTDYVVVVVPCVIVGVLYYRHCHHRHCLQVGILKLLIA